MKPGSNWASCNALGKAGSLPYLYKVALQEHPMFGIPGKQAVTLTPAAVRQIARLMAKQGSTGLRIGVKKGGCAGMEYTMDYVTDINPMDELIEQDGARVMIAPMAQMFLFGTEIDYETSVLESGFRFNNPNVAEACGCGESIKFKDQPAA
jgi:iron-sulfur cluster assembly protein